jgi:hypothetical protein
MRRGLIWLTGVCVLAVPALMSVTSCGSSTSTSTSANACAGQCAPPYELQVDFDAGTTHAIAQKVLTSCAGHNPVVIRVGTLRDLGGDVGSTAIIYTHVFGYTAQTTGLLKCLRSSGVATASWPD